MKSLCVFCGSSMGLRDVHQEQASKVGHFLVENKVRLVYGGASIGLMGTIADAVIEKGGEVLGVIPFFIKKMEIAHKKLTKLIEVKSMHERKKVMYDESDAFLALPGGIGTLDELCEIATWQQLGLHAKPIYIFNQNGFFNFFLKHLDHCVKEGFLSQKHRKLFTEINSLSELTL